jgi:hypothetical protein
MLLERHSFGQLVYQGLSTVSQMYSTFQILFYALRPGIVRAQKLTGWHAVNISLQLLFDAVLVHLAGLRPLIYLIMSSFFAGSLHPCAGHFIAEHYLWDGLEQETYSYYGPLNILAYNVSTIPSSAPTSETQFCNRLGTITNIMTSRQFRGLDFLP